MPVAKTYHYAVAVRCKRLGIPIMERGKWMIMQMSKDFEDVNRRYKVAQVFLRPIAGEMIVFKIDADDIGQVQVIGAYANRGIPKLSDIVPADVDIQKAFWRKAGIETGFFSEIPAPRPRAPEKKSGLFGWFANA